MSRLFIQSSPPSPENTQLVSQPEVLQMKCRSGFEGCRSGGEYHLNGANRLTDELKLEWGGLLLDRHKPPLARRFVVYFASGAYTRSTGVIMAPIQASIA
jgi:hypothetical protein